MIRIPNCHVKVKKKNILPVMKNVGERLDNEQANDIAKSKVWSLQLVEIYKMAKKIDKYIISDSVLKRIADCANLLEFEVDSIGRKKLSRANFCKNRFCPICNRRRSKKLFGQIYRVATKILQEDSKSRFIFVTFTQRNCKAEELKNELDKMNRAFSYLVGKSKTFNHAKKLKDNLLGYMKAIEVTYNSNKDTYHPHIHTLLSVKPSYFTRGYIKHDEWRNLWATAMGLDYSPEVCVETVEQLPKAVAEVGKYPIKLDFILKEKLINKKKKVKALMVLHRALKNRRMLTFGGNFKKFMANEENIDSPNVNLINLNDEEEVFTPIAKIFARYDVKIGAYIY